MRARFSLPTLLLIIAALLASTSIQPAAGQGDQIFANYIPVTLTDQHAWVWLPLIAYDQTPINPPPKWSGSSGGSVVCLAGDPRDEDVLYAGTWGGGVFQSTDLGRNWTWAGSGLGNYQIDSLVIDPSQSNVLYAGTHGGGLFKTEDYGQHWVFAGYGIQEGAAIYSLAVHPTNPQILFAATRKMGTGLIPPYGGVLYKTVDGGNNWYPVLQNVGGAGAQDWVYSLSIKASNPDLVLAATHEHGPYFTTSGGEEGSWQPATISGSDGFTKGRAVAFDPRADSSTAFYATWHGGFYHSQNRGSSWNLATSTLRNMKIYPNGIAFAADRANTMYIATMDTNSGVMKSTDAGRSWVTVGLANRQIYSVLAPTDGSVVFAGTLEYGLYKSINGGQTWFQSMTGMSISGGPEPALITQDGAEILIQEARGE